MLVDFAADEAIKSIAVPIIVDDLVELDETVPISLTSISNARINAQDTAEVQILNDDTATLTVENASWAEDGGDLTLTVTLAGEIDVPFTVDWSTGDLTAIAGEDYTASGGSLSFDGSLGQTHTISVPLTADDSIEADERFAVGLANVAAAGREISILTVDAEATILNDDDYLQQEKLVAMAADPSGDHAGYSVAVDGDRMVVGIPLRDGYGEGLGTAQVYRRDDAGTPADPSDDTWEFEAQLMDSGATANSEFGSSVAISGDTIVVGAPSYDRGSAIDAGFVHVFTLSLGGWQDQDILLPLPDGRGDRRPFRLSGGDLRRHGGRGGSRQGRRRQRFRLGLRLHP